MNIESGALLFVSTVLLAFWTVLIAELVGDKSLYTLGSLALRFRIATVLLAVILASSGKMLASVLLAKAIFQLHSNWTAILSATAFFVSALLIWYEEPNPLADTMVSAAPHWSKAALVCFTSLFFTEWGDPGQLSAAALTLRTHSLLAVWLGGTLAMITKGGLAITVGVKLRDRLPQRLLRPLACTSCCILGMVTLGRLILA